AAAATEARGARAGAAFPGVGRAARLRRPRRPGLHDAGRIGGVGRRAAPLSGSHLDRRRPLRVDTPPPPAGAPARRRRIAVLIGRRLGPVPGRPPRRPRRLIPVPARRPLPAAPLASAPADETPSPSRARVAP